jgi:BirA family biotin operon repressor/biotin-[acetyl-CoA-carboxylase] ligase
VDAAHPGTRFRVRRVTETGSTNADVLAEAAAGADEGLVIVADHQSAGRGRLNRTWVAPPGSSLLMSVLLRPPTSGHLAVCAVGCAAAAACGPPASLKWPNDLVVGQLKLGGILAEALGNVTAVVVGLGLNVLLPRDPVEGSTALDQLGPAPNIDDVLARILAELEPRYAALCANQTDALLTEYRNRCVTIGQKVRIEQAGEHWTGDAVAIDDDGALVVDRPGVGRVRVEVGDVVHLRPV